MNFKKINNIAGWAVFVVATITYTLTVERTASFWDCGEFIAAADKLQVPHPPGAPFFLLVGRMFAMLATDVTKVAFWVNMSSVLSSGFTILFLFWSITLISRKFVRTSPTSSGIVLDKVDSIEKSIENYTTGDIIKVIGAGLVGALAYTFSDSFWFSAVESEVYAMSSFFTAFVYWAMLKWEVSKDDVSSDKWILLICFMIGLSIGVHLLNLVTIPALALIIYYKQTKFQWKTFITTILLSLFVLYIINDLIIPGLPTIANDFDIFFVNVFGLPFNSGIFIFLALFILLIIFLLYYSEKGYEKQLRNTLLVGGSVLILYLLISFIGTNVSKGVFKLILRIVLIAAIVIFQFISGTKKISRIVNLCTLSLIFILIGYSSYTLILIRSNFNPPLDENNPENSLSFISYLKREQYGDRPLFYGAQHTGRIIDEKQGDPLYRRQGDKYVIYDYKREYIYEQEHLTVIPRLHSNQDDHVERYKNYVGEPSKLIKFDENGREIRKYSFFQNIKFMFTYQFGVQYARYFMWNFAGREYDMQGASFLTPFSDRNVPSFIAKNKGRNNYYFIPLVIGLLGFVYHIVEALNKKDGYAFFPMLAFFVLTGVALAFYLNQPPVEPRERDYIYVGSYYVFCIWIGLGVFGLVDALKSFIKSDVNTSIVAVLIGFAVPSILVAKNWDDHDRSGRFHSVDSAKNLLNSCAENAVLFTGGDNDTFPLWYVQDVEGFRTDVRVCNLSLLSTDWYVDQMKLKAHKSQPLPISWDNSVYIAGTNDYLPFRAKKEMANGISLRQFLVAVERSANPANLESNPLFDKDYQRAVMPASILGLDVDVEAVKALNIVPKKLESKIEPNMVWNIGTRSLMKADLVMLNMIATNNWKRPIYFSTTLSRENYLGLQEYLQQEGLAYRLLPVRTPGENQGRVQSDIMYENMMKKFYFRGLNDPTRYYDENYLRFPLNVRTNFATLAETLMMEGDTAKAKEVVDYCLKVMPDNAIPFDVYSFRFALVYVRLGEINKGLQILRTIAPRAVEAAEYYAVHNPADYDFRSNLYILEQCSEIFNEANSPEEAKKYKAVFDRLKGQLR